MPHKSAKKPLSGCKVLVAPLDWGMGHATRCVPVIAAIRAGGGQVIVAGPAPVRELLAAFFSDLETVYLPGYEVRYSRHLPAVWQVLRQLPRLLGIIKEEQQWLRSYLKENAIDLVISDNRYGLWSNTPPSIVITHQLFLPLSGLLSPFRRGVTRYLHRYLRRFSVCWVPDVAVEHQNLSGRLGHSQPTPHPRLRYTGPLTRFPVDAEVRLAGRVELVVLLSGPEPQRSLLEEKMLQLLQGSEYRTWVIRGRPGTSPRQVSSHLRLLPHLPDPMMQAVLQQADHIICRPGYSTLMDLAALGRSAVLVPTPGQPEQAYLAQYMHERGLHYAMSQRRFELDVALKGQADCRPLYIPPASTEQLQQYLVEALQRSHKG